MLIILEGPDGAGKTTLADAIESLINAEMPNDKVVRLHAKKPNLHPLDEYVRPLTWYRPGKNTHVICDRWHWGEAVYPKIHNRPTAMDQVIWWYVENYLRRLGAVVVMVDAPLDGYKRTYAERGDTFDYELLRQTRRHFSRIFNAETFLQVYWTQQTPSPREIVEAALRAEAPAQQLNSFVTYVGPVRPTRLLLGDVRNDAEHTLDPAFMPYRDTSGYFLLSGMLDRNTKYMTQVGIANACDVDDPHDLHWMLREPMRATLGANARAHLMNPKRFGTAVHPQYARRFHYSKRLYYADSVFEALDGLDRSKWPSLSRGRRDA